MLSHNVLCDRVKPMLKVYQILKNNLIETCHKKLHLTLQQQLYYLKPCLCAKYNQISSVIKTNGISSNEVRCNLFEPFTSIRNFMHGDILWSPMIVIFTDVESFLIVTYRISNFLFLKQLTIFQLTSSMFR